MIYAGVKKKTASATRPRLVGRLVSLSAASDLTDLLESEEERRPEHVSDQLGVVERQRERGGVPAKEEERRRSQPFDLWAENLGRNDCSAKLPDWRREGRGVVLDDEMRCISHLRSPSRRMEERGS